jgi:GNAT superfamily N-acetyltransferase
MSAHTTIVGERPTAWRGSPDFGTYTEHAPAATAVGHHGVVLRQALRADLPAITEIWVDAFVGDPYLRWIAPDDDTWRSFGHEWMGFIAGLCFERGHTFVDDAVAIAWIPPDLALVGPDDLARGRAIIEHHASTERAEQAVTTILAARGRAMEESHWTLQYVGVRQASTGQGLGAAAVAPTLAAIDRDGLPCGLTSSNPRNVAFYERLGFRVVAEVPSPDGAVTLRPMERR